MLLEGLHIPLTTPFHPDGRLNPHKLAANVVRYSKSPASCLIVLPPYFGEPSLLTDDETQEVFRTVAQAAAPEKVLLANISRDSVHATLALAEVAAHLHYDAVLVTRPAMLAPMHGRELRTFFEIVADRSPLPVVLVSGRSRDEACVDRSDMGIDPVTTAALSAHPNIIGMYFSEEEHSVEADEFRTASLRYRIDSMANVAREATVTATFGAVTARMQRAAAAAAIAPAALISASSLARNPAAAATSITAPPVSANALKTRTKAVGFQIVAATSRNMLELLRAGATAAAPAFAACAPQACYEIFAAWKDDDQPLADEKQQRILEPAHIAELRGPAGLKFGCDLNGYFGGLARLPHLPLTAAERTELQQAMSATRT